MNPVYRLVVIGHHGMYTYGDYAQTPELALLAKGNLHRSTRRLGIVRGNLEIADNGNTYFQSQVLVSAESVPGEWRVTEDSP